MRKKRKTISGIGPDKYLSHEQRKQLLKWVRENADAHPSRRTETNLIIVELLLCCGLRAGELIALKLMDLPGVHGKAAVLVKRGKGNKQRTVSIGNELVQRLSWYITRHRKKSRIGSPLFVSEGRGRQISYYSLWSKVRIMGARAGIGRLHPHMLRHTSAGIAYQATHDPALVRDRLGHKSMVTTEIYMSMFDSTREKREQAVTSEIFSNL